MNKEKVRQIVKARDGNWCLITGTPGPGLHLHRVRYPRYPYTPGNCVLLSHKAHNPIVHANKKLWQPVLLNYLSGVETEIDTEFLLEEPTEYWDKWRAKWDKVFRTLGMTG